MTPWNALDGLGRDVRYALRTLRRAPAFTAVALLSVTLGTGANTAIFSLIHALVLRQLPVSHPERLVEPLHRFQDEPRFNGFSWNSYQYFRDHNHVFSGLIAMTGLSFPMRREGAPAERVDGSYVTGNYFALLGVAPALGRLIGPQDDRTEAPAAVAVVSWAFWKARFDLDRAILGKQVWVDGAPVTIVGVTVRGFQGLLAESRQEIWLPLAVQRVVHPENNYTQSRGWDLALVGRLAPGTTMEQARAEMTLLFRQAVADELTRNRGNQFLRAMTFEMEPAGAGLSRLRDRFAKPLLVLMTIVGLLLLIACSNVASMLLARGAVRQREMRVRAALGAGRLRLMRQVLTESVVLSAAGSGLGVILAYFGTSVLVRIMTSGRERFEIDTRPDVSVLLFTVGVAVATGLIFGLAPAMRAWGTTPESSMREAGRGGDTRLRRLFARSLVAAQVALSLVLLTGAGLFLRYLANLYASLGFQHDHVLLAVLDPSASGASGDRLAQPYRELLERLKTIPGVRSATLSAITPVQGAGASRNATVEGYQAKPGELRYLVENWVAPRYFETLGTPLVAGRDFTFEDRGRPRVAIVNRAMARHYFGDSSPIGRHVLFDGEDKPYEIVGVVGDAKYLAVHEATPRTIYFNAFQEGRLYSQFAVRTSVAPSAVAADVRRMANAVLKNVTIARMTTLDDQVDASIIPERLTVTLSGWFGVLGAGLAAVGLYGLLAYTVARRVQEIGIRMALGATRAMVTRMVLFDALATVAAGLAIGAPLAVWGKRFAMSLIPDLPAETGVLIVMGGCAMAAVAMAAACAPARRAARVEPMEALRHE